MEKIKEDYAENKIPKPVINQNLRIQAQNRKDKIDIESVKATQLNNKKRLDNFVAIQPKIVRKKSKSPTMTRNRSSPKFNNDENNTIENNVNNIKIYDKKSGKKYLKPIYILHPKPEKPIDYLKELKEKRNMSTELENKKKSINFDDLFNSDAKNENIIESLEVAKIRTKSIDRKVERKKEIINSNGGYLKNPYLAGEIGDLLVESIQAKLELMNKLGGEE